MNKQRVLIVSFWGGIFVLLLVGLALYFNLHKKNSLSGIVLVQVNESSLTAGDLSEQLAVALEEYDSVMAKDTNVVSFQKNRIIESFIHRTLLLQWAEKNSVSVSENELEAAIQSVRANYPDDISFKEALAGSKQSLASWKRGLSEKLLEKKIFEVLLKDAPTPTEAEAISFYNQHKDLFSIPAQARIRQVVFSDEDTALRILHALEPRSDLSAIAQKYSVSPDAKNGGDTGWLEESSLEIFESIKSMKVGQRSPVVKTSFGYHIFDLLGRRPAGTLSFEEAKKKIYRLLLANKESALYSGWLEQQIRDSRIYKNTEAINAIQVVPSGD